MPVYTELPDTAVQNQIPMAGVIISLGAVGLLGLLFSLYSRPGRW
jgi:NADH:ubiquinone oxidoreductase subunit 4 (subunit M)